MPIGSVLRGFFGKKAKGPDYSGLKDAYKDAGSLFQQFTDQALSQWEQKFGIDGLDVQGNARDWRDTSKKIIGKINEALQNPELDYTFDMYSGKYSEDDFKMDTGIRKFFNDPGYSFVKDEGLKQINQQLASMGLKNSGTAVKEASEFVTGLASQEYGAAWNRAYDAEMARTNTAQQFANLALGQDRWMTGEAMNYQQMLEGLRRDNTEVKSNAKIAAEQVGLKQQISDIHVRRANEDQKWNAIGGLIDLGAQYFGAGGIG